MTMQVENELRWLVERHSGVRLSGVRSTEEMNQVLATMEYLARLAAAGNALVVALDRSHHDDVEDAIVGYMRDVGRAVDARTAKLGVSVVQKGTSSFEVG